MLNRSFKIIVFLLLSQFFLVIGNAAESDINERRIKVSMRMIGHQILMNSGDSLSRVMPIEIENGRYKIEFENEFELYPEELAQSINKIVLETGIAKSYLVEIESCEGEKVVHAYEIKNAVNPKLDLTPCRTRTQAKACHQLFVTILDPGEFQGKNATPQIITTPPRRLESNKRRSVFNALGFLIIPLVLFLAWYFYPKKKEVVSSSNAHVIPIGKYQFDKKNMLLSMDGKTIELTSKETDLLHMLFISENTTLERESILKTVWGDEGDYVGRTLDVFISKLRKKLAADSNLKIINIRGVGYKFVVNE